MLHLGLESGSRFLQAVDFVHESWHRWGVHLRQRLSQKRYCLKFLSSKFDFEEQSAAIWRQLVETHLTAASLSSLLPFSVPRAQEFSLHRAQQHRPIVVYNPQQQVINYIRAQFKNQRLTGLSALLPPCKIPSAQHSQSVNKVVTDPCVFTEGSDRKVLGFLQNTRQTVLLDCFSYGQKQNHQQSNK